MSHAPLAVDPDEAAEMLHVSRETVYRLMKAGRLRYIQLTPRIRRIPVAAITEMLTEGSAA